jgi:hypothetical protein
MPAQRTDFGFRVYSFESIKERFASFDMVASQYYQPPRRRLLSEAEHFLDGAATPPCQGGDYANAHSDRMPQGKSIGVKS